MAGEAAARAEREEVLGRIGRLLAAYGPRSAPPTTFWAAQFDHGLAWVGFPEGMGGLGRSPSLQALVDEELRAAGALSNWPRNPIGLGVAAPAIVAFGREDQARRHLRPLFTCAEVWCQLYSEPGAGSDLAALATTARADGDEWVLDGHKTWITLAHVARWGLVLARTDPDRPKHEGITAFVLDMHAPGVSVRPLRQMTGDAEFDAVALTGVRVPDAQRLGQVGEGWAVAMATLSHERLVIGDLAATRVADAMSQALRLWRQREDKDPALLDRLVGLWVEAEVARLTTRRAHEMAARGTGGPAGAVAKLVYAELNQRVHELSLTLLGSAGMLYDSSAMARPEQMGTAGDDVVKAFLRSRANTIEAGTSEILRNVLAERVLGLPPEPRTDKDRPWREPPPS